MNLLNMSCGVPQAKSVGSICWGPNPQGKFARKITNKNTENQQDLQKQQIPRGAHEAHLPWGAAEGGALVVFVFLVDFLHFFR